jgi:Rrf2 family protein
MTMLISTKGRYALRLLVDTAENQTNGYVPLKEVAERQQISEKYLESILKVLVQNGILTGVRGKGGGYRLHRPPDQITVGSVLRLTEGSLAPVACLEERSEPCSMMPQCRTYAMWKGLDQLITDYLNNFTIADLMAHDDDSYDYCI